MSKTKLRSVRLALLLLLSVTIASMNSWAQSGIDSAGRTEFSRNIPKPDHYVNDFEQVLEDEEELQLNRLAANVAKQTGMQFAIVTLKKDMVGTEPFDSLMFRIFNTWRVGEQGKNNGVVIGLSQSMQKVRITLGLGIPLTNQETQKILDEIMLPYLRKAGLATAVREGIQQLVTNIERNGYHR
ncbi:MAG: TPM domain-containing protein [Sphingobacteriales bacterium]|nr:MAG: TPM domain-containing protein [Sphingobacteriales bacterium]